MTAHSDSGRRCLVAHYGPDGKILPACIRCDVCHEYVRPEDWDAIACQGAPNLGIAAVTVNRQVLGGSETIAEEVPDA